MQSPQRPDNETQRLRTLQSLRILDTPAEKQFDQVTRMARRLFDVQIALVSLVDQDRQWFKSRQGLEASETPRDISFCGHAILHEDIFVVEDASQDQRFHDNPLVCGGPNIRFYAGYPLQAPNGHKLGTLCIIDGLPRKFTAADRELLCDLGALVEQQLRVLALATIDELTRIPNRRGFHQLASHTLAACARLQLPAALLALDLDGFKQINDLEGHEAGDRALVRFARSLLTTCREADVIGRLGGDEFCALLPGTNGAEAHAVVRRLERCIAGLNAEDPRGLPLAFSVGIAAADGADRASIDALMAEADRQMYAYKASHKQGSPAGVQRLKQPA